MQLQPATGGATPALPSYKRPPIGEVLCGIGFPPIKGLTTAHVGAFWSTVRSEFPRTQHATVVADSAERLAVDAETKMPWPRLWLVSADDTRLLQIQLDRFLFNWRLRETGGPYPRYDEVSRLFFQNLERFRRHVGEHVAGAAVPAATCELTYSNYILFDERVPDISTALGLFRVPTSFGADFADVESKPQALRWNVGYRLKTCDGHLLVTLGNGKRAADMADILSFELRVTGKPGDDSDSALREWMNHAHACIVNGFASFTTHEAQYKLWERE